MKRHHHQRTAELRRLDELALTKLCDEVRAAREVERQGEQRPQRAPWQPRPMVLVLQVDEGDLAELRQALRRAAVNFRSAAERHLSDSYGPVLVGRAKRFRWYEGQVQRARADRLPPDLPPPVPHAPPPRTKPPKPPEVSAALAELVGYLDGLGR